mmetsp:Transcript_57585/g.171283  ORF Transcript_57585/g.171283 Transcript_57585/m.171283 type:complete len:181 (-) Transcript_57585:253-795(-)
MHRGSALAGHYYALIKDLATGRWYEFNDSRVTAASESQLADAMGVGDAPTGGASAYLCMYRRVAPDNPAGVRDDELPDDLRAMVLAALDGTPPTPSAPAVCGPAALADSAPCVDCATGYDANAPTGESADAALEATGGGTGGGTATTDAADTADAPVAPPPVKAARAGERGLRIGAGAAR